jgi:BON domain
MDRTILARQALQEDPALAPLHLGVRVRNGVAILFGPVPSPELARRAVGRLHDLPALTGVRNELFPDPWGEVPFTAGVGPTPRLPGRATSRSDDERWPGPQPPGEASPWTASAPSARSAPRSGDEGTPTAIPPIAIPVPAPPSASSTPRAADQPEGVEEAARRLQQGEERFRRVRVAVQGSRVILSGAVPAWGDLYELSRAITRIPGVDGVTIGEVRTDPPSR